MLVTGAGVALTALAVGAAVALLGGGGGDHPAANSPGAQVRAALLASYTRSGSIPEGLTMFAPAANTTLEPASQVRDGKRWTYAVYRNQAGLPCSIVAAGTTALGESCTALRFEHRKLWLAVNGIPVPGHPPARWAQAYVAGQAEPRITRIDLVTTRCQTRHLTPNRVGEFISVFDRRDVAAGTMPYLLRAYDAAGQIVTEKRIRLLGPSPAATRAAMTHPTKRPACMSKPRSP
jgi:hypothetical protein